MTPNRRPRRPALWLLVVPAALYLLTPVVANRVHPVIIGLPFLIFYTIVVTIITPALIAVVAKLDPLYREAADEPVPADFSLDTPTDTHTPVSRDTRRDGR